MFLHIVLQFLDIFGYKTLKFQNLALTGMFFVIIFATKRIESFDSFQNKSLPKISANEMRHDFFSSKFSLGKNDFLYKS